MSRAISHFQLLRGITWEWSHGEGGVASWNSFIEQIELVKKA